LDILTGAADDAVITRGYQAGVSAATAILVALLAGEKGEGSILIFQR